jgi:hypothetical protein
MHLRQVLNLLHFLPDLDALYATRLEIESGIKPFETIMWKY